MGGKGVFPPFLRSLSRFSVVSDTVEEQWGFLERSADVTIAEGLFHFFGSSIS